MPTFTAEVFQNEYLAAGGTDVHAIVSVTCAEAASAQSSDADSAEVIIVDVSGSMENGPEKIQAARKAAAAALEEIPDGTSFAVIAGNGTATQIFPERRGMAVMDADLRREAQSVVKHLQAGGGTAIGSWLQLAADLFEANGAALNHAILLTDGRNEGEKDWEFRDRVAYAVGKFQCDARGVGSDWVVDELRYIATELLGTVELIADPADMAEDFAQMIRASQSRGVANAAVRVWAPQGAELLFFKQVSPELVDLTDKGSAVSDLIQEFPTGAWGNESRDYHFAVRVPAKAVGQEQLAGRVQLMVNGEMISQGLVKAIWSDDSGLTTRINPAVAHYTGQAELASVIQEGLAAKASGDLDTATNKLGRAVQLATETGNEAMTNQLRKVVDIEDPATGTVRLKRAVDKLDEMQLDTASTKTSRVR